MNVSSSRHQRKWSMKSSIHHLSTEPVSVGRQLVSYHPRKLPVSTEPVSVGRQLVSYRSRNIPFPPSPSRWDDNWSATARRKLPVSTEPVSVGRQLASYRPPQTSRFHRARLGGTTTLQLPPGATIPFPPSPSRWDDNWSATTRANFPFPPSPSRWDDNSSATSLRPGDTTIPFPPSPSRWDDNWSATARRKHPVSTEPVSVGRQLVSYRPRNFPFPPLQHLKNGRYPSRFIQ